MKIAWFTPFSVKSAIGRYSRLVTAELARQHEVEIWTFCNDELLPSSVPVRVVKSHADVPDLVREWDIAIYQLGNYWPFHGEIWRQSQRHPGIVILHDSVMHGFFASYFFEQLRSPQAYCEAMREWHGEAGRAAAADFMAGSRPPLWEGEDVIRFPMIAGVTARSLGVVSHSQFVIDSVTSDYVGPKAVFPLPYEAVTGPLSLARRDISVRPDQLLIITVGHVNPNKCVDQAFRAIGALPEDLRERVVYAVIGPVEENYGALLLREAEDAGIARNVRLDGYMVTEMLHAYLAHADVCINLRYPNTEAASASLVEQMLAGKAVITNGTGWFAELPAAVTRRVSGPRELAHAVEELLGNANARASLGRRAREYAENTFRADAYAQRLDDFIESVLRLGAVNALADSLAARMRLLAVKRDDAWVRSVAYRAAELFGHGTSALSAAYGAAEDPKLFRG